MPPRHAGRATRRAAHLGIEPSEQQPLASHPVQVRRFKPTHFLDGRDPDVTERRVVPHDVDNVRRRAMFLAEFFQPLIESCIFCGPTFSVLSFQHVVLGVMNNR